MLGPIGSRFHEGWQARLSDRGHGCVVHHLALFLKLKPEPHYLGSGHMSSATSGSALSWAAVNPQLHQDIISISAPAIALSS